MKSFTKMAVTCLLAFVATTAWTQENRDSSRRQFAEQQAAYIVNRLALSDETAEKFTKTFLEYRNEIWQTAPQQRLYQRNRQNLSEKESEELLKKQLEHRRSVNEIREKYYRKYSEFLTQKQILRVYDLEKNMMRRFAGRKPNRKGQKGHRLCLPAPK